MTGVAQLRPFGDRPTLAIVSIIKKIRRASHSARALQFFAKNNPNAALLAVEAMTAISPLSVAEQMWTYYPLVAAGRYDDAFDILDMVCRDTDDLDGDDNRFVNLCARAARASYNGDNPLRDRLLKEAKRLKPKTAVRMWSQLN